MREEFILQRKWATVFGDSLFLIGTAPLKWSPRVVELSCIYGNLPTYCQYFPFEIKEEIWCQSLSQTVLAPDTKQQKPLAFSVKADQSCCWTISSLPPNIFAFLYFPDKREAPPPLSFPDFSFERQPAHFKYFKWNEFCYADRSWLFFFSQLSSAIYVTPWFSNGIMLEDAKCPAI